MSRLITAITISFIMTTLLIGGAGAKDFDYRFVLAKAGFHECVEECGMVAKKCREKCEAAGQGLKCAQKCDDAQNKCHKKCHQLHD